MTGIWICLSLTGAATADTSPAAWGIAELMEARALVAAEHAVFSESRHLQVMPEPVNIKGELDYRAPDYMSKTVLEPEFQKIEISGDRVIMANARGQRRLHVNDHPALEGVAAAILGMLSGNRGMLENRFALEFDSTREGWRLDLLPKIPGLRDQIERIRFEGEGASLLRMHTYHADGDTSLMRISPPELP